MKPFLFSIIFFASVSVFAAEIQLGNPAQFAVKFDDNGELAAIIYQNKTITLPLNGTQWFDFKQNEEYMFAKNELVLKSVDKKADNKISITRNTGNWITVFHYEINPATATLKRTFEFEYTGKEPTKIKSLWTAYPTFPFKDDADFFIPGQYPPQKYTPDNFAEGQRKGSGKNSAPLVFQLDKNQSIILLSNNLIDYADHPNSGIERRDGGVRLTQSFNVQGHVKTGTKFTVGDAYFRIINGGSETALLNIRGLMKELGLTVPKDRPKWFESATLYSFHPGGTIGSNCKDLGGFTNSMPLLDRIKEMCNAIWLMPLEDKSIYWPRDYYKFQDGLGTTPEKAAEEYKALVDKAHELGLRVLQDSVPHGGGNPNERSIAHPEWLVQDEDGTTFNYWGFDFNSPTWIDYMADVSRYYMKNYGIDGYRVDACGGSKVPNWNEKIPYSRASHSQSQGGLNMLRAIRKAVKEVNPDGGTLAEVNTGIWGAVSDATYDFDLCYNVLHDARKLPADEFVNRLRRWLHEQQYSEIPDMLRLRHVESHDSLRAQLWYGTEGHLKMLALTAFIHGIPLVYHEQEIGNSAAFKNIFKIRAEIPELNGGDADYISVEAPAGVFAVLRTKGDDASIVIIDFNEKPVKDTTVKLPLDKLPAGLRNTLYSRQSTSNAEPNRTKIVDNVLQLNYVPQPIASVIILRKDKVQHQPVFHKLPKEQKILLERNEIKEYFAKKSGQKYYGSIYWRPQGIDNSDKMLQAEEFILKNPQQPLRSAVGGYIYETAYYKLRLTRSGTIMSLNDKDKQIIHQGDIYTDYGYGKEKLRYAACNDVEAGCRIVQDGGTLRLRFEGQLRGQGRFDLMKPPVEYFIEYALKENSSSFAMSCGVKTHRVPADGRAFLAVFLPLPNVEKFEYYDKDGKTIAEGTNIDAKGRSSETKSVLPERVILKDANQTLLELSGLKGETSNLFLDRKNFFVTFDDGQSAGEPNKWRTFTALIGAAKKTQREAAAPVINVTIKNNETDSDRLLNDGGFESSSSGGNVVSTQMGEVVISSAPGYSAWQTPDGGALTHSERHGGSTSVKVSGKSGEYRLFQQDIPLGQLKSGMKLQLSAWVKGDNLVKGDEGWQVGCVRFAAIIGGQMQYISSPSILGTFDWRKETVEFTVPEKLTGLTVQVGSNGAAGTIWVDDVVLIKQ